MSTGSPNLHDTGTSGYRLEYHLPKTCKEFVKAPFTPFHAVTSVFLLLMAGPIFVEHRCVVVIGKSGTGKSTVASQIAEYDFLSEDKPPFDITPTVQPFEGCTCDVSYKDVAFERQNTKYKVTVIDTVGLFDPQIKKNSKILEKIETYFDETPRIQGINLILFVLRKDRFTDEEEKVFSLVKERCHKEISPFSALVLTGCENENDEERKTIVTNFRESDHTKKVADQMEMGIFTVGFPQLKGCKPGLRAVYEESILEDREALINLIIQANSSHITKEVFHKVWWRLCTIL